MRKNITLICLSIVLFYSSIVNAKFTEGKEYQRAPNEVAQNDLIKEMMSQSKAKAQVLEFFSYGCPGCQKLDPAIDQWQKKRPPSVDFQRVPVTFHAPWASLTKTYYTLEDLKVLEKLHGTFFKAIHSNEVDDASPNALAKFFETKGVKPLEFMNAYQSFDVNRKQKWAGAVSKAYRITIIPAVIVQGPKGVFITTPSMTGDDETLIKVVNHLVDLQQK